MSLSSSTAAQQQEQAYVPTSETSSRPTMNESRHAQSSHPNSRAYNGDTDAGRPHDFEQQRLRGHDRHNGSVDHEFLHQAQPRYPSNHHDYTVRHFEGEDHYQHAHARQELRGHVAAGMEHGSISYGGSSQSSVYLKPERQPQQHLPGRLPSPSPTVAPTSPDWQTVSRPQHDHYQQQHPQHHHLQPQRAQQQHHTLPLAAPQQSNNGRLQAYSHRSATNLISPCISEVDMGTLPDTRALPPLFSSSPVPAFSSPQQQQQSQGGVSMLSSRLLPPPAGMMKQDDAFEARVASPPALHSTTWSSKHHHHRIPIRSPVRGSGQELMTTSTTDSQSSEYMKMDFYDIYLRNPKLLRPQGGRSDERAMMVHQHQGQHTLPTHQHHQQQRRPSEEYGQWHSGPAAYSYAAPPSIIEPSKPKAVKRSPSTGLSRRQSMPLMSTATRRVLRHEDAHLRNQQDDNVVQSLMVGGHHRRGSTTKHNSMSIRNLLTHDHDRNHDQDTHNIKMEQFDDQSSTSSSASSVYSDGGSNSSGEYTELGSSVVPYASSSTYGDNKPLIKKRKKTTSATAQDEGEEPKKRKRISKKQLLESGGQLLDEEGNPIMKKRKRTKKPTDPDHVSPSGFRHGGERVVQEPEELVVLEPDVGPISMLDVKNPPRVIWKGQPLSVVGKPGFDQLHPHEEYIAATLRLSPAQYLTCKRTLILASREYLAKPDGKQFRKSDAQKLCRIDVNKTSRLWEVFAKIGWLAGISERDI
ncbi:hypothetical protein BGZ83_008657 [Gryganskiella cystojenkinii]|nr:hypothetical protein BGZ83_008657 [Gryganskiella cystojenkinii]